MAFRQSQEHLETDSLLSVINGLSGYLIAVGIILILLGICKLRHENEFLRNKLKTNDPKD